ncbi:putative nucleic acid-binding protein [Stackebrandtia albiflava]|uniref:Ribonuclease VapC n=1 Tax=Stackebrandtia albiflava TaxID=406432 RepID=A0A562UQT9_9ACTN|nr:type II toxin-antitoxin system VapC family toxin [Stackebrandtia albiflava]TWJ07966.1 putative nucleic acid-binding protein [Stackebrandtia albiflava]
MTGSSAGSLVIDASAVVALLTEPGAVGHWVAETISGTTLHAPELMWYEATNILRRARLAGLLSEAHATLAHSDLLDLNINLDPYRDLAGRIWELRDNVTSYDAAYVALAELRGIPLLTLDVKLARASGPRARILTPPAT